MSTKLRIIIVRPDGAIKWGGDAIQYMFLNYARHLSKTPLPAEWDKWTKKERLLYLMRFMPPSHKLVLLREPKWTRKRLSKYKQLIAGDGSLGRLIPQTRRVARQSRRIPSPNFRPSTIGPDSSVYASAIEYLARVDEPGPHVRAAQTLPTPNMGQLNWGFMSGPREYDNPPRDF